MLLGGSAFAQFSIQKVVFEEFTGAWCQYCADGAYRAEQLDANYPDALMIAVHDGDAMEVTSGSDMAAFYGPAYPQALFNRSGALVSRGSWSSTMGTALQGAGSVTVSFDSVGYNQQTRQLTATVRAMFTGPESGDLRINLALTEAEVTGTGSGYNQANADNNTPGHPYQGAGNPILGFVHKHVLRDYLGGAWGVSGIIPSSVNFGAAFTHTFTTTLPAGWDDHEIGLVAFVSKYGPGTNDREILNGEEFELGSLVVGREEMTAHSNVLEVIGNPVHDLSKVVFSTEVAGNYSLEVVNMLGQKVAMIGQGFFGEGLHTLTWDGTNAGNALENGIYLIRLMSEDGQVNTKRVMLAK